MKLFFVFGLLVASVTLFGQNSIDLFSLSYRYGLPQSIEEVAGEATEHVGLVNAKLPVVLNESSIWFNNLTYQMSAVNYSNDIAGVDPVRLHGFILQTGWVQKLDNGSAIQLLAVPRLMTDFENVDLSHFQLGGIGLYEKRYHDKLMMRYGLMYNRELFGHMFVPLVHLDWQLTPKWSIVGMLPIYGKINYHYSEKLTLGISHFGLITSYQLGEEGYSGDYMDRKSIDVSLFGRYQVIGNIHVEARVGYALGRSYAQYNEGDEMDFRVAILSFGDDRVRQNFEFDPGPIVDLRLVYNLPLE